MAGAASIRVAMVDREGVSGIELGRDPASRGVACGTVRSEEPGMESRICMAIRALGWCSSVLRVFMAGLAFYAGMFAG